MGGTVKSIYNKSNGFVGGTLTGSWEMVKGVLKPKGATAQNPGDMGLTEAERMAEFKRQKLENETQRREWSERLRQLQWAGPSG